MTPQSHTRAYSALISCRARQARYLHRSATSSSSPSNQGSTVSDGDKPRRRPRVRATSKINHSAYRPLVLAHERLIEWHSPYSDVAQNKLLALAPPHVLQTWQNVMANSVTEEARGNYGAGLLRFTQFCDAYSVPESLRIPASEPLLALFVSEMGAGKVQPSTIDTWLSGLALWHDIQCAHWYGGRILSRTKQGAAAMAPPSPHTPRLPVTEKHLNALRSHLCLEDPFDAAVWAVASVAWHSCSRLGELIFSKSKPFQPSRHVHRGCPRTLGKSSNDHEWMNLFIPFTKTTKYRGDWISITSTNDDLDPLAAIRNHLRVNDDLPQSAPLFAYRTQEGWHALDKESFLSRCSQIWSFDGLDAAGGHSFRIGGTTHLLLLGVEPWVVMKQGRWSSKAFLLYWRKVEEILPLFIGDAMDKFSSLKDSISRLGATL
ncbi:DNA breaking-rejoining enzyme [Armillaria borealis]|uniref:DNA breaking-rejoining enzyme n=1 Tax=Armillaria borealis TaxID=47425 RepID=A0AA39K0U9_9AGAR|nr:DNA breaking-rejoining enzyme [Armillaria borealis]